MGAVPPTAPAGFPLDNTPTGPAGPRAAGFRGRVQPIAPRARGAPVFRGRGRGAGFDAGKARVQSPFLLTDTPHSQYLPLALEPPLLFLQTYRLAREISIVTRTEILEHRPRSSWIMAGMLLLVGKRGLYETSLAEILNEARRTTKNQAGSGEGRLQMTVEGQNDDRDATQVYLFRYEYECTPIN